MPSVNTHLSNAIAWAVFIETLVNDGGTVKELAEESGLSYYTVRKVVHQLRKRKAVYISSWEKDALGRASTMCFTYGNKRNVPRPKMSNSEKCGRYYQKQKQIAFVTNSKAKEARIAGNEHILSTPWSAL